MTVKISNCGSDERGRLHGGKAGDQTGGEWSIRDNYERPWKCVLRLKDSKAAKLTAELAVEAAENDGIGYDQNERTTFWTQLAKSGYRPSRVSVACETDCSAGVMSILKAVGRIMGVDELAELPITSTHYMRAVLKGTGLFRVYTARKYTRASSEYLRAGDILLNDAHHTAIVVTDGAKARKSAHSSGLSTIAKEVIDGKWGNGAERRRRLEAAGYDYDSVQAAVNALVDTTCSVPDVDAVQYVVTAKSGLNVRQGPGAKYTRVRVAPKGSKLAVVGMDGRWAKLADGTYAAAKYLRKA